MKLWIDDLRPMPEGYDVHSKSVFNAEIIIDRCVTYGIPIEYISLDHDAGAEYENGGDFIKVLDYLEFIKKKYGVEPCTKFHIHTGNAVGAENMRRIIKANNWTELR